MKLIAETAWHHQGDYNYLNELITKIVTKSKADIVKMHITLDFDEYMDNRHDAYPLLKPWVFDREQWSELIQIVRNHGKQIMLLLNDVEAVRFGLSFDPEYVEIHSVCLNDVFLLNELKKGLSKQTKVVLGVGGTSVDEIDHAITFIKHPSIILMFGFQNFPTAYEDVNLNKIRKIMRLFDKFEYGYADHTAWDNPQNELVTLLGAACGMSYIEKHVTSHYGEERVDSSSAISIEMLNCLQKKLEVLESLNGNGELIMNEGERSYSLFGPMKKAAVLRQDLKKGDELSLGMIKFIRTRDISDMSQIDVIKSLGKKITKDATAGSVLMSGLIQEKK